MLTFGILADPVTYSLEKISYSKKLWRQPTIAKFTKKALANGASASSEFLLASFLTLNYLNPSHHTSPYWAYVAATTLIITKHC